MSDSRSAITLYCDGCGQPVQADETRILDWHVRIDHHPNCTGASQDCAIHCPIAIQCGPVELPQAKLI